MKTWGKIVLGLILLGVLSFASHFLFLILNPSTIIRGNTVVYHSKEELTDLYWQNSVVLNSVKDSVLLNDSLLQAMNQEGDGDIGIFVKGDKDYFSEEEWDNIVSVFENLHPYMSMMERKGRPLKFYIDFSDLKLETGTKRVTLYWFPSEKEMERRKERSFAESIEVSQLDGNWYIVEEKFPWS